MNFEALLPEINKIGINLYRAAIYENGGIQNICLQPCSNCANVYSVAKAFAMTAIGMLYDDGKIDPKAPVISYMGDLAPKDADPAWKIITVEQVLTHRCGFGEGFLDIDVEDVNAYPTDDFLDIVFHHPITYLPGTHYQYSDAAFYLISRLVSRISGEKLDDFLMKRLFNPLGFHEIAWSHCPHNYPMGATGLYIGAKDMVKLPALYLEEGLWQGKRILSKEWVDLAIAGEYELHARGTRGMIGKGGMYGQMMMFNRERRIAVAWQAFCSESEKVQRLIDVFDSAL